MEAAGEGELKRRRAASLVDLGGIALGEAIVAAAARAGLVLAAPLLRDEGQDGTVVLAVVVAQRESRIVFSSEASGKSSPEEGREKEKTSK